MPGHPRMLPVKFPVHLQCALCQHIRIILFHRMIQYPVCKIQFAVRMDSPADPPVQPPLLRLIHIGDAIMQFNKRIHLPGCLLAHQDLSGSCLSVSFLLLKRHTAVSLAHHFLQRRLFRGLIQKILPVKLL